MQATTEASADPPTVKYAGELTVSHPYVDQAWMLMTYGWLVVAVALLVLVAMGRWRWGAAAYVLVGVVGLVAYHWAFWTYPGSETVTPSQAVEMSIELLPMHLSAWVQLGLAALMAGGLLRGIVVRARRARRPG
jgi:hypothetical protein